MRSSRLIEAGAIDDERFAVQFAADKRELRGWGPERIREALSGRGLDGALIEAALAGEGHSEQVERAIALLERPRRAARSTRSRVPGPSPTWRAAAMTRRSPTTPCAGSSAARLEPGPRACRRRLGLPDRPIRVYDRWCGRCRLKHASDEAENNRVHSLLVTTPTTRSTPRRT